MTQAFRALLITLVSSFVLAGNAAADDYADTVQLFKNAGQSGTFFDKAYGYAVFPTVGKGALGIGGARGKGRVYAQGKYVGDTTLTQLSIGFQAGGQAYSQIVFFEDERAYREFTSGEFGFGAGVSAVAITAAASATASTTGNSAGISGGKKDATTTGEYYKGMAVFTIAKGGLMYEAALAGQKFSFRAKTAQ
ncbi:MAG: YSC84-related protein [Gammaproteobacteria bacterium]|jgi:lipid-binding SYLF domain-containing protein